MSDKPFNFFRCLAEIGITAIGTFYKVVAEIWGLGYGEAVLATCVALSTLIGVWVEYSRYTWNKAQNTVEEPDSTPIPDTVTINREDIE